MTQDEIIRMAREAGFSKCFDAAMKAAEKAVDVAIAIEREACAKVCKDIANSQFESGESETAGVLDHCAAAIRARGE